MLSHNSDLMVGDGFKVLGEFAEVVGYILKWFGYGSVLLMVLDLFRVFRERVGMCLVCVVIVSYL